MDADKYHRGFLGNTSFAFGVIIIESDITQLNKWQISGKSQPRDAIV
jgi:hypothetical protein